MNNICKCKSAPDYHRDDCPQFDIYGNIKKLVSNGIPRFKIEGKDVVFFNIEESNDKDYNYSRKLINAFYKEVKERQDLFKKNDIGNYKQLIVKTQEQLSYCYVHWELDRFKSFHIFSQGDTDLYNKIQYILKNGRNSGILITYSKSNEEFEGKIKLNYIEARI